MLEDETPDPATAARRYFAGFTAHPNQSKRDVAKKLVAEIDLWLAEGYSAPSQPSGGHQAPAVVVPKGTLDKAADKLRWNPRDPRSLWDFYDAFYKFHFDGVLSPRDTIIPDCPYTERVIDKWMRADFPPKYPFVLPETLSEADSFPSMTRAFPTILAQPDVDQLRKSENESGIFGWMSIDAAIDAPYRVGSLGKITGLDEGGLRELFDKLGRSGQTVNVYALSGQVLFWMWGWGRYPDCNGTDSRLLGTRFEGRPLGGSFDPTTGRMVLDFNLGRNHHAAHLGGRSIGDLT